MNSIFIVLESFDGVPDSFTAFKTREEAEEFFVGLIKENAELAELSESDFADCKRDGLFTEGSYELYLKESRNRI